MKHFSIIFLSLLFFGAVNAQTFNVNYSFERPDIKTEKSGYSVLQYKNCMNFGDEGSPSIPLYAADLLLSG